METDPSPTEAVSVAPESRREANEGVRGEEGPALGGEGLLLPPLPVSFQRSQAPLGRAPCLPGRLGVGEGLLGDSG